MPSIQFKIWEALVRANYKLVDRRQSHELKLGKGWEMPRPPKILNRKNKIKKYKFEKNNIFICNPEKQTSDKVIFYLHGGGYFTRILLPHWIFIQKLSNRFGMKVFLLDYPTAPAYNYLQTYSFVKNAYLDLIEKHKPEDVYFFGDSAGGGLALTLSQGLKEDSLPQPAGLFLLSPWLDVSMTNPEIKEVEKEDIMLSLDNLLIAGKLYAEDADLKDPLISPLYGILEGLPDIHLFIGTHDMLLPDCRKFKKLAKSAGTSLHYYEYKEMLHCWMFFPIPEAEEVIEEIENALSKQAEYKAKQ